MTQLAEVLPCTLEIKGSSPGSQPFLRVISALLSFLTLSMVPYLKKPECQTNLEDEVQPKGRGLFIGIVEQLMPTATKKRVRNFISSACFPLHLYFFLCFSFPLSIFDHFLCCHTEKNTKYSRVLQAEGLHKDQQRDIGQA